MSGELAAMLSSWLPVLYLVISIALVYAAYYFARVSLRKLRLRGIVSRKFEETAKLVVLAVAAAIVVPAAISALFPHPLVPVVSLSVLVIIAALTLFSVIGYVSNSLSYLIVALTSTIRDGEYVRIVVNGREYEGRAMLIEGNYLVLRTEPGVSVLVPYSQLLKSVIVKLSQLPLTLRIRVVKPGGSLEEIVKRVSDAIRKSKLINKTEISVKPVEVSEDEVVLMVETEAVNPKSANNCFEDIAKILLKEIPYKITIEVVSSR
ncbi:MAG: hypothetical protein RMH84_00290 [Sulfolobales archaeon]|nr:hypothetical protein [Sulfolobales archaeon]MCX8208494.1 hypothetical protein [Sulfolobales archaeon]MDW8010027.1 hypothetical protein [Sulfolobales archaeon]